MNICKTNILEHVSKLMEIMLMEANKEFIDQIANECELSIQQRSELIDKLFFDRV